MRDAKAAGKVNRPGFSLSGGEVSDGLGVILRRFHGVFLARVSEGGGLHLGGTRAPPARLVGTLG